LLAEYFIYDLVLICLQRQLSCLHLILQFNHNLQKNLSINNVELALCMSYVSVIIDYWIAMMKYSYVAHERRYVVEL